MTQMRNKHISDGGLAVLAGIALCTASVTFSAAQDSKVRILQTNSAGDNTHIIDPATNKVVGEIKGMEAPHGIAVAPNGSRIYVSDQADKVLTVIDGKSLQVTKRIPLSGNPNLVDITPDGRWIYVAIAQTYDDYSEFPQIKANPSGGVDVIDSVSLEKVKTIPFRGGIHDLNVTPDGKFVVAGSSRGGRPAPNLMNVIDTRTNEVAWSLRLNFGPSPMAILSNPDGSPKWVFSQDGVTNTFSVIDFAEQKKINEVKLPEIPADKQNRRTTGGHSASHGIMLTADQKMLLVNSRLNSALYAYSVPDLKLLGTAVLGGRGAAWLVITPDDKTAYVANEHTNNVSAVDIKSMKEVALIPVGFAPARNAAWTMP
jgi:YVTN family beta-propeller protein